MSINVKKYTKDQMAKMVEEAQAEVQELKRVNAALTEQISQMNGEAINKANEIANLKADADALRNKLAESGKELSEHRAATARRLDELKKQLAGTEAALGWANAEVSRLTVGCRRVEGERDYMHKQWSNAKWYANYAEAHPWRNLWAWVRRKLVRHE